MKWWMWALGAGAAAVALWPKESSAAPTSGDPGKGPKIPSSTAGNPQGNKDIGVAHEAINIAHDKAEQRMVSWANEPTIQEVVIKPLVTGKGVVGFLVTATDINGKIAHQQKFMVTA